jgi:hypothetical protein
MTQPPVFNWATAVGGTVIGGLTLTAAEWVENINQGLLSYGVIEYSCSGSPDLSGVQQGHRLVASGFSSDLNNGTFPVLSANNSTKKIRVLMTARKDDGADETGASASGEVITGGALLNPPTAAKQGQGYVPNELPNALQLNWMLNIFGQWLNYLAAGGANILRASLSVWRAVTRTGQGLEWIQGQGAYRFKPTATDEPGEGFLAQDTGAGRGIIEAAHPDAMTAFLAGFQAEVLPAVTANLDFDSTAANAISTQTVTVPGALPGDAVILGPPAGIEAGFLWAGFVSAADIVTIRLAKITSGTVDPAAANWTVRVIRPNTMPVITARGQKIYFNLIGGVYTGSTLEDDLQIAENAAAFELLVNSRQHRAALLDGGTIEAVIAASATADDIILATGGY